MNRPWVTILYEDRAQGGPFGPHEVVVRCVRDLLPGPAPAYFELQRRIRSMTRNGIGNVLRFAREDVRTVPGQTIALLDSDRIVEAFPDPAPATPEDARRQIEREVGLDRFKACLLERNMESLLQAAMASARSDDLLACQQALSGGPAERDIAMRKLALERNGDWRQTVKKAVPSFDRFIQVVVSAYVAEFDRIRTR